MSSSYDENEIDRVPTFIPMDVEATERRHSRPNSARRSTSGDNVTEQSVGPSVSSESLNDDIAEYIRTLINKVILQLTEENSPKRSKRVEEQPNRSPLVINEADKVISQLPEQASPRRSEREEEEPFKSPTITNEADLEEQPFQSPLSGEGKGEEYYTPRSDDGDKADKSPQIIQDDFELAEDTGSQEFALMDIPIQEDPESPVRYSLSAQLLAEIDETLNSILNLEESNGTSIEVGDEDWGYEVDEGDSSILIDYSVEMPLDLEIAAHSYYFASHMEQNSKPQEDLEKVGSPDRMEYPMTADIEDTFNVLLEMTHKSEYDEVPETLGSSSLSDNVSGDVLLRAGLSDLEDLSGTSLRKSIKTPDVTQDPPMDTNPLASSESTDDEDGPRGFVIMNDSEIKESLLHYEKFKERLLNEKKSARLEDVQPVIVEMENKEPEEARSYEEMPFRRRSPVHPVRRRSRARSFFRRAASALGLIKTTTWTPTTVDERYRVKADDGDGIEVITTSFGGEPGDFASNTLPCRSRAHKQDKFDSVFEMAESADQDTTKSSPNAPNRRFLNRLTDTNSLPRSSGRARPLFKTHK